MPRPITRFEDQKDFDFDFAVEPPMASYVDTLRAFYGWEGEDVDQQIEWLALYAVRAYRHFGGTAEQPPFPVDYNEVEGWVTKNCEPYGTGQEDIISRLAHRYIMGEGDNYAEFTEY